MIIIFWISIFLIVYTFVGYGFVLFILVKIKWLFTKPFVFKTEYPLPTVTVMVAAYNEEDIIEEKIENTLLLNYPKDKIQLIFITDGSSDRTQEIISGFTEVTLLHEDVRAGKMAAIKRAIPYINGEITVFTDANTFLNSDALLYIARHYADPHGGRFLAKKGLCRIKCPMLRQERGFIGSMSLHSKNGIRSCIQ